MLERIEKLQIAILGLLVALGLIIAVKSGVSPFKQNSVTVTGSAYEIVTSDSGSMDIELEVKAPTKAATYAIAKQQVQQIIEYLKEQGTEVKQDINVKAQHGH